MQAISPGLAVAGRSSGGLALCWVEEAGDPKAAARSRSASGSSSSIPDDVVLSQEETVWDSCAREGAIPCTLSQRSLGNVVLVLSPRDRLPELSNTSVLGIFGTDWTKTLPICSEPEALGGVCARAANLVDRRRPMFA